MEIEHKQKAAQILNHYGAENQRRQLIEECAELIQAINKYDREISKVITVDFVDDLSNISKAEQNIAQEIADVLIMIEQNIQALFDGDESFINKLIEYKLNRQLKRIKEEESKRG